MSDECARNPEGEFPCGPACENGCVRRRFEVSLLIGPCTQSESEDFLVAVVGFAENYAEASALNAVGAIHPFREEQVGRLRGLLAKVARLERWVSIGSIDSHAKLSPVSRDVWDEIQEALRRG